MPPKKKGTQKAQSRTKQVDNKIAGIAETPIFESPPVEKPIDPQPLFKQQPELPKEPVFQAKPVTEVKKPLEAESPKFIPITKSASGSNDPSKTQNKTLVLGSTTPKTEGSNKVIQIGGNNHEEVKLGSLDTTVLSLNKPKIVPESIEGVGPQQLSEEMKMKLREQRFTRNATDSLSTVETIDSIKQEQDKLTQRAKKFGILDKNVEEEKLNARAQRFGIPVIKSGATGSSNGNNKLIVSLESDELLKRNDRAKRFGTTNSNIESVKKQKRVERFGVVEEQVLADEEKKLQRIKRFKDGIIS